MSTKEKFIIGATPFVLVPVVLTLAYGKGSWTGLLWVAALMGFLGLVFYTMLFGFVYVLSNAVKGAPEIPLLPGEQLLTMIPANHLEGFVAHGGKLRVTTQRLIFLPHGFNFKLTPVVIDWANVDGVAFGATAEFALLKLAIGAVGVATHQHGLHLVGHRSDVLRVRHGQKESRFVVTPDESLINWLNASLVHAQAK
jgi:hypothetical protein